MTSSLLCAVIGAAVLATAVTESGAAQSRPEPPAPAFRLQLDGQRLTAAIDDAPLHQVLDALAREARVQLVADVPLAERITARFQGVSLEEALRRLLPAGGVVLVYGPAAGAASAMAAAPLVEIRAYSRPGAAEGAAAGAPPAADASAGTPAISADAAALAGIVAGSEDRRLRRRALEALGDLEAGAGVPALGRALRDDDPGVRETAAAALGRTWDAGAVDPLARALLDDGDVWVREAAARALGAIWSDEAADVLGGVALSDGSRSVREAAVEALGRQADPRAVPFLVEALRDPTGAIRERAAEALAAIGSPAALAPLGQAASTDGDPWVRQSAAEAMARLSIRAGP